MKRFAALMAALIVGWAPLAAQGKDDKKESKDKKEEPKEEPKKEPFVLDTPAKELKIARGGLKEIRINEDT